MPMPSKREAARRQARYYLDILRNLNEHYRQGGENVPRVLAQLDLDWLQIQQGQAHAASYARGDVSAAVMCIAYPWADAEVLGMRLAPSEYIAWLGAAQTSIQNLKTLLRKAHTSLQKDALLREWISYLQDFISRDNQIASQDQETQHIERAAVVWNTRNIERECLSKLGEKYTEQGQYKQALKYQLQALDPPGYFRWWEKLTILLREGLRRMTDPDPMMGAILYRLGDIFMNQGHYKRAMSHYKEALEIARTMKHRQYEANALGGLGLIYKHLGQYEQARDYFQQALDISRELCDRHNEGIQLGNIGEVYRLLKQYGEAIKFNQQALAVLRELGDKRNEGKVLGNLGTAYSQSKQYRQAIECYQQALDIAAEIGDRRGEGDRRGNLGNVYMYQGDYEQAGEYHQQALAIEREIGHRRGEALVLYSMGYVSLRQGQFRLGREYLLQADILFVSMGIRHMGVTYMLGEVDRLMQYAQPAMQVLPCEVCGRWMLKLEAGAGYVLLSRQDLLMGIHPAEECWECGRLYCDNCYPSRSPNSCVCGKGRDKGRVVGNVHFRGSLHLVKVRDLGGALPPDLLI